MTSPSGRPARLVSLSLLLLALLLAAPATAEYLGGITFDKATPSFLPHGEQVVVTIDYKIDEPAGGRVFARPYTDGAPSPGYAASGAALLPQGTGTTTQSFTITAGEVVVDEVRIYLVSADQSETRLEIFVPVHFQYGPHGVFNVQPNHSQFSRLRHGMDLVIDFDYAVSAPGCKIYARPMNGNALAPGYSASGSPDLPPSGSATQSFSFDQDADITHIRFRVYALDNTTLLAEFFVPWDCHWRQWGIYDIAFNHPTQAHLHNSQNVVASFTIDHEDPNGVRVWIWSLQDGGYCPGSVYQGSALEPAGPHAVTRYTRVNAGMETVDAIRFIVGLPDDFYLTFDVRRWFHYGPHALQDVVFDPAPPAILSIGERLDLDVGYVTDAADGVRVFARGAYEGELLFGMTSSGSPVHPAPAGMASYWLSYGGDTTANQVRIWMTPPDQSETYLEVFQPGWFIWAGSGTVTPVTTPVAVTHLGACYPNPFNPTTTVPVTLGRAARARLAVYDLRGRLVAILHDGDLPAGAHAFTFDGRGLGSGAYLARLTTPDGVQTRALTLIK